MAGHKKENRVVIAGAGFAGFNAARELSRLVGKTTEIVVISSTDYFLYLLLMPQVAGGLVEPRAAHPRLAASPAAQDAIRARHGGPRRSRAEGRELDGPGGRLRARRLRPAHLLTIGSVDKLLPIPGLAD